MGSFGSSPPAPLPVSQQVSSLGFLSACSGRCPGRGVGLLCRALSAFLSFLPPLQVKSSELQTIKTELTQIKSNIDALLGRLEQIAEEQKLSAEARKKAESSKSEVSQEDTASEAEATAEEPLNGDEGEEEGLAREECEDELENSHYTDVEDARLQ
uniref:RNA-binding protein Raly-like n=1 Tax=Cyanistes caeruleus TaxID=156563 RepID=A0A8C0UD50_CYACU